MIVAALREKGVPHAYLLFAGEQHGFRKAENIRAALDGELSFYAQVCGFDLPAEAEGDQRRSPWSEVTPRQGRPDVRRAAPPSSEDPADTPARRQRLRCRPSDLEDGRDDHRAAAVGVRHPLADGPADHLREPVRVDLARPAAPA